MPARHGDVVDEGLVDLQDVDRAGLQQAERRVPGAEVVQRDPHARAPCTASQASSAAAAAEDRGLGDLDGQAPRRQAGRRRSDGGDHAGEVRARQLPGRDVDADLARARRAEGGPPVRRLAARLRRIQAPSSTIRPLLLGDRDEVGRADEPAAGWCQRTSASTPTDLAGRQGDDRLVHQRNWPRSSAVRSSAPSWACSVARCVQPGVVAAAAGRRAPSPRTSRRRRGAAARTVAGAGGVGDADAGPDQQLLVAGADRLAQCVGELGDQRAVVGDGAGRQQGELVAAEAGHQSPGAQPRARAARPTAMSSRSPTAWPSRSLIALKSSRSMQRDLRHRAGVELVADQLLQEPPVGAGRSGRRAWPGRSSWSAWACTWPRARRCRTTTSRKSTTAPSADGEPVDVAGADRALHEEQRRAR